MSTTPTPMRDHPVLAAVVCLHAELDRVLELPVWSLDQDQSALALTEITRLANRTAAFELRVAGQAEEARVEELSGASSTANWWAVQTRMTRAEAHRKIKLAHALADHGALGDGVAAGGLSVDQAGVIAEAVDALPDDIDAALVAKAEAHLVELAGEHDAKDLRRLGKGVLTVLAPEIGEAHDAAALEREEREAEEAARFTMVDDGHGKVHGRFTLSTRHGAMLKKALLAYAAPKHQAATGGPGAAAAAFVKPTPHRMGLAFAELIEGLSATETPTAGGTDATVVVTMNLDTLLGGLKPAVLDTGEEVSAAVARLMACGPGIIPAVLGTKSQVLDLGRKRRFHTKNQRIAMALRDGGCTAEGCDWPPGLCHAHHQIRWTDGGTTTVDDGRLLCPRHHTRAHDRTYEMAHLPGGKVAFTRRT